MSIKSKNIYLIRHGETDWNRDKRFQGKTDIALNSMGREQALMLVPQMSELKIELAYSSHLSRAFETAQLATQNLRVTIFKEENLAETNLGQVEGLTLEEIIAQFGADGLEKWRSYNERDLDYRFPQGESKREMMVRIRQAVLEIAQSNTQTNIAVFAHGMVMRALTYAFNQGVAWDLSTFSNGSIHHFSWEDKNAEFLKYLGKINFSS